MPAIIYFIFFFYSYKINCKAVTECFSHLQMNNYIARSYREVIVITKFATIRFSKAEYSHVLKQKTY